MVHKELWKQAKKSESSSGSDSDFSKESLTADFEKKLWFILRATQQRRHLSTFLGEK